MSDVGNRPAIDLDAEGVSLVTARIQRSAGEARAECMVCGTHAYMASGLRQSGTCGNCGSFELRELMSG
jgi:Zn finger protein HypA/HybF involved in hydrogenase expression